MRRNTRSDLTQHVVFTLWLVSLWDVLLGWGHEVRRRSRNHNMWLCPSRWWCSVNAPLNPCGGQRPTAPRLSRASVLGCCSVLSVHPPYIHDLGGENTHANTHCRAAVFCQNLSHLPNCWWWFLQLLSQTRCSFPFTNCEVRGSEIRHKPQN